MTSVAFLTPSQLGGATGFSHLRSPTGGAPNCTPRKASYCLPVKKNYERMEIVLCLFCFIVCRVKRLRGPLDDMVSVSVHKKVPSCHLELRQFGKTIAASVPPAYVA